MIPIFKVFMPDMVSDYISDLLYSGKLSYGEYTKEFERRLSSFIGNERVLAISGNSILFALKLIDIKPNDEVIVSPMSCLMTTQPIVYSGAKVVWADIDPLTGSLDPDDVKNKITNKTRAIIHYHWSGNPGYIDEINSIAHKNNIPVIEDATESFGAEYKGKKIGNTDTDIVCYSFTPVRLPNAIDGAGLSLNCEKLYQKSILMRDLGVNRSKFRDKMGEISADCDIDIVGDSATLNNISGYVGSSQMPFVFDLIEKQRKNALLWEDFFKNLPCTKVVSKREGVNPSYWAFTILSERRDELLNSFRNQGVYASKIHLRNDLYSIFGPPSHPLRGVDEFSKRQLNLPCGWWMDENDFNRIVRDV
ncbi:DegT/DnrJ/EryC1/StrS family aminotransferase [Salinivibrio sp. DV]|uniref:DegT/DnrJ/EryC1/StrS family aminotransferase n=1 Tax=Salinivibrio sp. SS2 TaxID=1892894 RepID=UPI00084BE013|nr:aminotransferase class V-fold PLP-dependent enzyme [Salinivibrio sp. DV]ODP99258.1 hypothetical protein BGK46_10860 [Salinivibrio sp. DV]